MQSITNCGSLNEQKKNISGILSRASSQTQSTATNETAAASASKTPMSLFNGAVISGGAGAVVRSLPSDPKVPGSIHGSAESGIFGDLLSR